MQTRTESNHFSVRREAELHVVSRPSNKKRYKYGNFSAIWIGEFMEEIGFEISRNPHVQGIFFFFASVILAQIFLVLKKKQFEKVQLSEMNF